MIPAFVPKNRPSELSVTPCKAFLQRIVLPLIALVWLSGLWFVPAHAANPLSFSGTIVFVANLDGNWDLFLLEGGSPSPLQLTHTPLDERAPAFSPDGQQIAYSTSDGALWRLSLSTRKSQRLSLPTGHYHHPAWSADGRSILYASSFRTEAGEDADLEIYSFTEDAAKSLLTQPGSQEHLSLSPSGVEFLYTTSLRTVLVGHGVQVLQQLWQASLETGTLVELLSSTASLTHPAWSPDGQWIAFSSDREGTPDLWLMPAHGGPLTQLTHDPGAELHPAWSPDGQALAYISRDASGSRLNILDRSTGTAIPLFPFDSTEVDIRDPDWK